MFTINIFPYNGRWLAYLLEDSEYYEIGKTRPEAIGRLIELMIENKLIDNIEINKLDETERASDVEIISKLNKRGIL